MQGMVHNLRHAGFGKLRQPPSPPRRGIYGFFLSKDGIRFVSLN